MRITTAVYTNHEDVNPSNKPKLEGFFRPEEGERVYRAFARFVGDVYTQATDGQGRFIDDEHDQYLTRKGKKDHDFRMFWSDIDAALWIETRNGELVAEQVAILESMVEGFQATSPGLELKKLNNLIF